MRVKMSVARRCFEATRESFLSSPELIAFLEENGEWLKPYAVFRALAVGSGYFSTLFTFFQYTHQLCDPAHNPNSCLNLILTSLLLCFFCFSYDSELFGTAQHWKWGALAAGGAKETVERLSAPGSEIYHAVALHYYVQFHLDAQLCAAAKHAAKKGVILKVRLFSLFFGLSLGGVFFLEAVFFLAFGGGVFCFFIQARTYLPAIADLMRRSCISSIERLTPTFSDD
jgi:4-alpha-glucanotransferase